MARPCAKASSNAWSSRCALTASRSRSYMGSQRFAPRQRTVSRLLPSVVRRATARRLRRRQQPCNRGVRCSSRSSRKVFPPPTCTTSARCTACSESPPGGSPPGPRPTPPSRRARYGAGASYLRSGSEVVQIRPCRRSGNSGRHHAEQIFADAENVAVFDCGWPRPEVTPQRWYDGARAVTLLRLNAQADGTKAWALSLWPPIRSRTDT